MKYTQKTLNTLRDGDWLKYEASLVVNIKLGMLSFCLNKGLSQPSCEIGMPAFLYDRK